MNFQEAIYKLYNDEIGAIKRKNILNGRYIFINDTGTLTISNTKDEPFLTYIPSIDDILTEDWEIYQEDKPKTYSFQEALEALEEGKIMVRLNQCAGDRAFIKKDGIIKIDCLNWPHDSQTGIFSYDDILFTNWEIIEEV